MVNDIIFEPDNPDVAKLSVKPKMLLTVEKSLFNEEGVDRKIFTCIN